MNALVVFHQFRDRVLAKCAMVVDTYVALSTLGADVGAGLFAEHRIPRGRWLGAYTGLRVYKDDLSAPDYVHGYVVRTGSGYIDTRDPNGRLVTACGSRVDVSTFGPKEWTSFEKNGVSWDGASNLLRFVNHGSLHKRNCVLTRHNKKVGLRALRDIEVGEELFINYGPGYWRSSRAKAS